MQRPPPPPRRCATLLLTALEPRDNPAIPVGLLDIATLSPWSNSPPAGYEETHTVTRNEANVVRVDQSGTGSSGTFTVTVSGSAESNDAASGEGLSAETDVTSFGIASSSVTYHLFITGTYADGVFTVTSETYTETGSYSSFQDTTWTYRYYGSSDLTYRWIEARYGQHSLSWTAEPDANGQLVYTSYSLTTTDTGYWYTFIGDSGGGYSEYTAASSATIITTGSGSEASYSGTNSWSAHGYEYTPDPNGGPPYEYTTDEEWTHSLSGTTDLDPVDEPTDDWEWRAVEPDATDFTFYGVAQEYATLTESVTFRVTEYGTEIDVNSFNSYSLSSDSGHVVEDEPGVPESGSGTELFHRDEYFRGETVVTGTGSYVGGSAYADYDVLESGLFSVHNRYTVNDEETSGYDEDDEPFDLVFNFDRISNGYGITVNVHHYHEDGSGVSLTGVSFGASGSSQVSTRSWGTRNGVSFDDTSESAESWSSALSLPGESGPVATPTGMEDAFPRRSMVIPSQVVYSTQSWPQQLPTTPVPGRPGQIQDWYNRKVMEIGEQAKKLVANQVVKKTVLEAMQDTQGQAFPSGAGTVTLSTGGSAFAKALGLDKELGDAERKWIANKRNLAIPWVNPTVTARPLTLTWAVDQASQNPRSGKVVVQFRVDVTVSGTLNGQPISQTLDGVRDLVEFHDGKIERMRLREE